MVLYSLAAINTVSKVHVLGPTLKLSFRNHHVHVHGPTHMDSFFRGADVFVAEVSGVDESAESVLEPRSHSDALTGTTAVVKVLPHLQVRVYQPRHVNACMYVCMYVDCMSRSILLVSTCTIS